MNSLGYNHTAGQGRAGSELAELMPPDMLAKTSQPSAKGRVWPRACTSHSHEQVNPNLTEYLAKCF